MAQVVQSRGWVGPIVMMAIGVILLVNGVPALIQWLPWIAQTALIMGTDYALEAALVPLIVAGAASFIGFLMLRGGFGALRQRARGAASRAREQARGGVQQVRREASQRSGDARRQADQLVSKVPQSWRERIQAAADAVEHQRVTREADAARPAWDGQGARRASGQQAYAGQGQQLGQGQRLQQAGQRGQQQSRQQPGQRGQEQSGQRPPQSQSQPQSWEQLQHGRPPQGWQPSQAPSSVSRERPGAERLARIDELRARLDSGTQQAHQAQDAARQAAEQTRRAARAAAERVQQGLPLRLDEATEALVGQLDLADAERIRRRGSSLTRSSLSMSSLAKTSLSLDSLLQHRR